MAITTGDSLIAALASATTYAWAKSPLANLSVGNMFSYWTVNGSPVSGAAPTTAATCTSATPGAIPFNNPTPPALTYVGYLAMLGAINGVIIFDRLSHMGGLSGTSAGVQSVNLFIPASRGILTDDTNAEWFVECYADMGVTSQNLTITYVNTASITHTVSLVIPGTMRTGRLFKIIPTVSGDVIASITSCQLSGSTGSVGNFGFTCARKLTQTATSSTADIDIEDFISCGAPIVPDNACLWITLLPNGAVGSSAVLSGYLKLLQG